MSALRQVSTPQEHSCARGNNSAHVALLRNLSCPLHRKPRRRRYAARPSLLQTKFARSVASLSHMVSVLKQEDGTLSARDVTRREVSMIAESIGEQVSTKTKTE